MWTVKGQHDFDTDYYTIYKNVRHWSVDQICKYNLSYEHIPDVTSENQNITFTRSRSKLDLKAFKKVKSHIFETELVDGKYIPIT
jgi:hypothetical protein